MYLLGITTNSSRHLINTTMIRQRNWQRKIKKKRRKRKNEKNIITIMNIVIKRVVTKMLSLITGDVNDPIIIVVMMIMLVTVVMVNNLM
jgi:protein-S-isoprenylcysteine O-methyltransferase Ste14